MEQTNKKGMCCMNETSGALALKEDFEVLWTKRIPGVRTLTGKGVHEEIVYLADAGGCEPNKGPVTLVGIASNQIAPEGVNISLQEANAWGIENGFLPSTLYDAVGLRRIWRNQEEDVIAFMAMIPIIHMVTPMILTLSVKGKEPMVKPHRYAAPRLIISHPKRIFVFRAN